MSSELVIGARGLSKAYAIYDRPQDRLKQMLWRNRRRFYREFWALRDVDLDVYRGETMGVIGRNGSGKSTLLQLICGTLTPSAGSVKVNGRIAALLELGAGFNPEFTGRENVFVNGSVLGLSDEEIRDRFDRIEAFADIGPFIDQPVKQYSSGMYARLAFAVAIHVDPDILIVDEILAVGDAAFQRKCMERFYEIRDRGCTILFVSHEAYQVKTLCERAIYLKEGQPVMYGPADDVVDRYTEDLERASARRPARDAVPAQGPEGADGRAPVENPEVLFRITDVRLENKDDEAVSEVHSGDDVQIRMRYKSLVENSRHKISFVVNLYRHDELYLCGTTTLMEGMDPFDAVPEGEVLIRFPRLALLAGRYMWRVAIADHRGMYIHAQARHVCPFRVADDFRAAGLVDLPRDWHVGAPRIR
jgi:ABC-type polysaccharide/polyol phosphate transport system ATPase subunit